MISRSLIRQSARLACTPAPFRHLPAHRSPQILSTSLPAPARSRILARWYSEAQKAESAKAEGEDSGEGVHSPTAEAGHSQGDATTANPLQKELEAKSREAQEFKDKYLRSVADFRNLQERSKREQASARDFAIQKFAKDLIESVDNLDLALSAVPEEALKAGDASVNKELKDLHGGLKMTESILMSTLKKHGLERFDPSETGDAFDPNRHEATFQAPQQGKEDGSVFYTAQKGFLLNNRVLRAAKVGVVKNS